MFIDKVILKQKEAPGSPLLTQKNSKHFRSKMPHTTDSFCVAQFQGRYLTGIDEDSFEINMIRDAEAKEKKKKEVIAERLRLESATGYKLDALSDFWETFRIELRSDDTVIFNKALPKDCLKFYALLENGYVAPSTAQEGDPRYKDARYYAYYENVANKETAAVQKVKDLSRAELLRISDNKEWMVLVGQTLEGPIYTLKQDTDTLYTMLSSYIEDAKNPDNRSKFLKTVNLPKEELQLRGIIDKAFRQRLIKKNGSVYQRGQVTLGKTVEEVNRKLRTPEFANEFLSIKTELEAND